MTNFRVLGNFNRELWQDPARDRTDVESNREQIFSLYADNVHCYLNILHSSNPFLDDIESRLVFEQGTPFNSLEWRKRLYRWWKTLIESGMPLYADSHYALYLAIASFVEDTNPHSRERKRIISFQGEVSVYRHGL